MSPPLGLGEILELRTQSMSYGGKAVARHKQFVIFVERACADEELRVEITRIKKNFAEAKILEILKPSPFRRLEPCPHASECGGCQWQHMTYDEQVRQKQDLVLNELKKWKLLEDIKILPIVSGPEFHYRNRVQIRRKNKKLGFYQRASHKIVDIEQCLIADSRINEHFSVLRNESRKQEDKIEVYLENNQIHSTYNQRHAQESGFRQVNELLNQKAKKAIEKILVQIKVNRIIDLYCGSGNLSIDLKGDFKVIGVDKNLAAIQRAQKAAAAHCSYYHKDVELFICNFDWQTSDLILLDPPRLGCDQEVLRKIVESPVEHVIYMSCNPSTFVRDLVFIQDHFQAVQLQVFDMFPQTYHVETLSYLKRL